MKLRRISSGLTVVAKFILPPVGLLLIARFWSDVGSLQGPVLWWFYLIPVLSEVVVIWHAWGLKWVAVDDMNGRLYISDYFKEISVPLSDIIDVKESFSGSTLRRIKIMLRQPSEFGDRVVFLGTYRFGGLLAGPHPIVGELLILAAKARESHA